MGIQLDEHAYQKLIDENIEALNKYMPEHSLEKKHTIEVLKWSVQQIYHRVPPVKTFRENDVLSTSNIRASKCCENCKHHDEKTIGCKHERWAFCVVRDENDRVKDYIYHEYL